MTISKKSLLTLALTLGMNTIGLAYDAGDLTGNEATQICNFTQSLRQTNNKDTLKLAQWLEHKALDESDKYVTNSEISIISKIISDNTLTLEAKIALLSQSMAQQKSAFIKRMMFEGACFIATTAVISSFFYIFGKELFTELTIANQQRKIALQTAKLDLAKKVEALIPTLGQNNIRNILQS